MSLNNVTPEDFGTWLISMHAESIIKSRIEAIDQKMITNLLVAFYGTSSMEAEEAFYNGMLKVLGTVKDLEEGNRPKPSKKLSVDNGVYDPDDNLFFIDPKHPLARQIAEDVRWHEDKWVFVAGRKVLYYDDETLSGEMKSTCWRVLLPPTQDPSNFWKYKWGTFIRASDWIKEFENANADH